METSKLRKFASFARKALIEQVGTKMKAVLAEGSLARRENAKAVADLEAKISDLGKQQTIETVAYTWFNRFCALRYMDVNRYTKIGILSPAEGQFLPEILGEAKAGHIDDEIVPAATRAKVIRILDETDPSNDPQGEAYRLLLVAACNHYHSLMPFMFEQIADYTELLLPEDLLSGSAIPTYAREALLPANCSPEHTEESVEVIGWLYQFYIADKKDDVFAALKKGKKITPENIPAATQLFTPHWIVRYLVENSLGRLWVLNHPDSKLADRMDYYIRPEEPETDFLKITSPEELKVCDPACGSGHMLTYAFDLLFAIYEEQGYQASEIAALILKHNLHGIEIDQRAGALAAFALQMKAREKYRRFLSAGKIVQPNICVLENVKFDPQELDDYMDKVGRDLFTGGLQGTLNQWEEADNFGSLIRPLVTDVSDVLELLRERKMDEDLFLVDTHQKVLEALRQADYLSPNYHVVVANPPYMKTSNFNPRLKKGLGQNHKVSRSDLFAICIERFLALITKRGFLSMITMQTWMFKDSYKELRRTLLDSISFTTFAQLGTRAFTEISGEIVQTCAFVIEDQRCSDRTSAFFRLVDGQGEQKALGLDSEELRFDFLQEDFKKFPDDIMVYWAPKQVVAAFQRLPRVDSRGLFREGIHTGDNPRFLRHWHEVSRDRITTHSSDYESLDKSKKKWVPYNKGGTATRWYGELEWVIAFDKITRCQMELLKSHVRPSQNLYFKAGGTWPDIGSRGFAVKFFPAGFLFDQKGPVVVGDDILGTLALLNSKSFRYLTHLVMPSLSFRCGTVKKVPMPDKFDSKSAGELAAKCVELCKDHWDQSELSWDYVHNPTIAEKCEFLENAWITLSAKRSCDVEQLKETEDANDNLFRDAFSFSELEIETELDGSVPVEESSAEKNGIEFISYAVGCMLGRYSLDKPGLILANQGDTLAEYLEQVTEPSFMPDDDNVIPMLDGDWFTDDISERFKEFLKVTFGTEHYAENLKFLEDAIYPDNATARKRKTIRDYFLKEFYNHHVKLYKKRPIYWLFSSPKGTFNALIYMHRYRPDCVSSVLQYLRDFRDKLAHAADHAQMVADSGGSTKSEQTKALKEVTAIKKQLKDLEEYERDTLFPLAQKKIEIDLDDGVKHNYPLFGKALKKVTGLS
ncbi:N-6 DNA Methylase [Roseimaritima multifibrata]|uniref:site-specific DNA-methyltransferase (adenine-specific) n=1 Tax=Roseimaritima multifibrata TaxID=1930274 RepID=A0A517MC66_9BACT|nr:BREX-1 system adenine-specific DNA-methyltransferase PglX [Roseimaritima multifibrata]QDS92472.1 N-6 DNA Methylase [Roseimaritima multifibrata]